MCYRVTVKCYCVTVEVLPVTDGLGLGYRLLLSHSPPIVSESRQQLANLATYYPRVCVYARI